MIILIEKLRLATPRHNMTNQRLQSNNALGLKGVSKYGNRFVACIKENGKTVNLGYYNTAEEAKEAYDEAAIILQGEHANHK